MAERNLSIRLAVMDGGKVKAELKEIGESGEKSLKKIELAGQPASKSLIALNAAANDMKGAAIGLSSQMGPLGAGLAALGPIGIAAGAALGALTLGLTASAKEAALAEQAQNRLQGVLRATGYASGLTGKDIAEMAEDMEHSTLTNAEAVKNAASILATFRSVSGDTFKQAIRLAQDMSAVFGHDLTGSATQLGKALEDPINGITALRRVGVSFTESQKDVIAKLVETGQKAEAQKLILAALEQQVGGAAAAETQGLTGAAHRLSVAWGDMLKAIGQTEIVGGTAEAFLNRLASTFRITTEVVSTAPLDMQLQDAKKELAEIEAKLVRIRDIPFILQPRGNVDKHVKKAEELRQKIEDITNALKEQKEEQERAEAGRLSAEKEGRADLLITARKNIDEALAKLVDDPAEKIAKINAELAKTKTNLNALRETDGSNAGTVDTAIKQAEELAKRQINAIQKPIAEAAQKEADANQKVIDDLKQKLLGIGNERQAFIDQAVSRLSNKASAADKSKTRDLAAQLFDEKAFASAEKVIADLGQQMDKLSDKRKAFVSDAVAKLPETATQEQVERTKQMAAALYDQTQAQEKLDKLRQEGKQITDGARGAEEAYADQIQRLTEMLNAGAISQEVFNKAKDKAYDEQLAGRTDGQAGAIRAFRGYQKEAENTADAVEEAFSEAMKATEDAIVNMVTSGEISLNSLNDLANSIVADITRMMVQQSITGPLAKWMGSSMESGGFMDEIFSSIFHEGGVAGEAAPSRQVPSFIFAGAPRYHGGGIAGLKPDEVPAILQRGEEVVSRKDRQRRSTGVNVVMHITTPDANSFRASQAQVSAEAARGINRARRNL
ncbi:MAG: phage tail tape measure C-terminal domain-containing protein [Alphaproteobacteria bacterium]|jgi:lambda family phage tail tape measure protein|nr:phage tail tape measure C-terminal domain-containing protein [Alphaproteobacteria bacterium]